MAKIDVSGIEGYADMTAEQKVAALEAYETPAPDYSGFVKKDVFDKTASELAAIKKANTAKLSEDERKKAEDAEKMANMEKELGELRMEKVVSGHKAKFLGLGYDEQLAEDTAKALVDGDMEKVFANQKAFLTAHDKNVTANAMKNTPTPPAGNGTAGFDYNAAIAAASARGDYATVARLMSEQQSK